MCICHITCIIEVATECIVVDVGGLDSLEAPSHCPTKESHLNRRQDELEEKENRIAIDSCKVLPRQSEDIVGTRDVTLWVCGAPARVGRCRHS